MDENGLDLYDTVMPVFVLSKILGLAPFRLRGIRGNRKFKSDLGLIIVLRFIGIIGAMLYVAHLIEELNFSFDLRSAALRCELYIGSILTAIMLIMAVSMRNLLISTVEDIIHIDDYMRHAGIHVPYKNARRFSICQIIFISCVFSSKAIMQPFIGSRAFLAIYNIFNIVDYINTITLFQYVDIILLLRQRYIWLNRKIKSWSIITESKYEQRKLHKDKVVNKFVRPTDVNNPICFNLDIGINVLVVLRAQMQQYQENSNETDIVRR
ncbi:hypothetical protein CBL_10618 [Carabus blaptoides fortunei]